MKIRQGFVTNSSSSSFVIAVKKDIEEGPMKIFLDNIFEQEDVITSIEELNDYIVNTYGYRNQTLKDILEDDEYARNIYRTQKAAIEKDMIVVNADVEHDAAYWFNSMAIALEKAEVLEVLERD